jgi:hypothetical protein
VRRWPRENPWQYESVFRGKHHRTSSPRRPKGGWDTGNPGLRLLLVLLFHEKRQRLLHGLSSDSATAAEKFRYFSATSRRTTSPAGASAPETPTARSARSVAVTGMCTMPMGLRSPGQMRENRPQGVSASTAPFFPQSLGGRTETPSPIGTTDGGIIGHHGRVRIPAFELPTTAKPDRGARFTSGPGTGRSEIRTLRAHAASASPAPWWWRVVLHLRRVCTRKPRRVHRQCRGQAETSFRPALEE